METAGEAFERVSDISVESVSYRSSIVAQRFTSGFWYVRMSTRNVESLLSNYTLWRTNECIRQRRVWRYETTTTAHSVSHSSLPRHNTQNNSLYATLYTHCNGRCVAQTCDNSTRSDDLRFTGYVVQLNNCELDRAANGAQALTDMFLRPSTAEPAPRSPLERAASHPPQRLEGDLPE